MIKRILLYSLFICMCMTFQNVQAQDVQKSQIENEINPVVITLTSSRLNVKNAQQMTLTVYNLTGTAVLSVKVDSADKTIDLGHLQKGIYMVRIGKTARKIVLSD